jgi:hypothetical protein
MYLKKQVDSSVPCRINIEIKLFARAVQEWARRESRDSTDIVLPAMTLTVTHIICIVMCLVMPHTWRGVVWNLEKGVQCISDFLRMTCTPHTKSCTTTSGCALSSVLLSFLVVVIEPPPQGCTHPRFKPFPHLKKLGMLSNPHFLSPKNGLVIYPLTSLPAVLSSVDGPGRASESPQL